MTDNLIILLGVLVVAVAVAAIIILIVGAKVIKAIREIRGDATKHEISPQPLMVQREDPFATQSELAQVKEDISAIDNDLKSLRREIVSNGEQRRISIEGKVEAVRIENTAHIESVRVELGGKIDDMEGRIIATLNNTGAIGKRCT